MLLEMIIVLVAVVFLGGLCGGMEEAIIWYLDAPSLICILILSVPLLFRKGMGKDFVRAIKMQFSYTVTWKKEKDAEGKGLRIEKKTRGYTLGEMRRSLDAVEFMQKQILYAGLITVLLPVIFVLGRLTDVEVMGANLAVALIAMLYTAILELLLLPLQLDAKRRIVNYMEEE